MELDTKSKPSVEEERLLKGTGSEPFPVRHRALCGAGIANQCRVQTLLDWSRGPGGRPTFVRTGGCVASLECAQG